DLVVGDDLGEQRAHVEVLGLERHGALLEPRHLEQVLRELLESQHVALGALGELTLSDGERAGPLSKKELHRAAYDGQRTAEVMRHGGKEIALHLVDGPQRLSLGGLLQERLALTAQSAKLAEQPGHEERREQIHGHGEEDPFWLERVAICVRTEERDRGRRERHRGRTGQRPARTEAETAGDDEKHADDVRRPARIGREREDAERDDDAVEREHGPRETLEAVTRAHATERGLDRRGLDQQSHAEERERPHPEVREEWAENECEARATEPREIEGALEA